MVNVNNKCSEKSCKNKPNSLGLCKKHYDKIRHKVFKKTISNKRKQFYSKNKKKVCNKVKIYCSTDQGRFKKAIRDAKYKGKIWKLTFEEYVEILGNKKCFYCNSNLPKQGSGLDRMDNTKGYIKDNVLPCCYTCNTFKRNLLSYNEMLEIINIIKKLRNTNNIWADSK